MRTCLGVFVGAACLASVVGCAEKRKPAPVPPPVVKESTQKTADGLERTAQTTITARVVAIDKKNRTATLRGPEGNETAIKVGPEVRNFDQVKKGDDVVVTYYESLAVKVLKAGTGTPGIEAGEEVARAEPGQLPAAVAAQTATITATVTGIDKKKQTVTLKGPRGRTKTVKVQDPSNLDKVKVGDLLRVTYTEALAIAVEKPAKRR